MLEYDMIDVFIGIAIYKTNGSGKPNGLSKCFIYRYWRFPDFLEFSANYVVVVMVYCNKI